MANRFVGLWGSNLAPMGSGSRLEGFLVIRRIDDTHVGVRFIDLDGSVGPEVRGTITNTVPPTITFSRPDNGATITYTGKLVRNQPLPGTSRTKGTFARRTALLATEEGDWTANRPPPRPRGDSRKRGAKKATGAKKASAKKAASQKSVSKKKGSGAKKSARPGKAGKKAR